jgi:hypothetical protein
MTYQLCVQVMRDQDHRKVDIAQQAAVQKVPREVLLGVIHRHSLRCCQKQASTCSGGSGLGGVKGWLLPAADSGAVLRRRGVRAVQAVADVRQHHHAVHVPRQPVQVPG